jgi:hypothetical protein
MPILFGAVVAASSFVLSVTGLFSASAPSIQLVDRQPLVVQGAAFRPFERVSLTALTLLGPKRVSVRATRQGAFRARIRIVDQPCGRAFAVRALGRHGSRATLWLRGDPCVPPPRE